MTFEEINTRISEAAVKMPSLGKSLKLVLDEGIIHIDLTGEKAVVSHQDLPADCTITTSISTIEGLRNGDVNPMMAMMNGKVKVKGDLGIAMKFQDFIK